MERSLRQNGSRSRRGWWRWRRRCLIAVRLVPCSCCHCCWCCFAKACCRCISSGSTGSGTCGGGRRRRGRGIGGRFRHTRLWSNLLRWGLPTVTTARTVVNVVGRITVVVVVVVVGGGGGGGGGGTVGGGSGGVVDNIHETLLSLSQSSSPPPSRRRRWRERQSRPCWVWWRQGYRVVGWL